MLTTIYRETVKKHSKRGAEEGIPAAQRYVPLTSATTTPLSSGMTGITDDVFSLPDH